MRGGYLEVAFVADLMVDCLLVGEVPGDNGERYDDSRNARM